MATYRLFHRQNCYDGNGNDVSKSLEQFVYRLLGKLIVGLTGFFLLLSLTTRALGSTQPPNLALRGFTEGCEDKPQPCWYGIVPGVTAKDEVMKLAQNGGYEIPYTLLTQTSVHPLEPPICNIVVDNDGYKVSKITLCLCVAKGSYTTSVKIQPGSPRNSNFAAGGFLSNLEEKQGLQQQTPVSYFC